MHFDYCRKIYMQRCFAMNLSSNTTSAYEVTLRTFRKFLSDKELLEDVRQIRAEHFREFFIIASSTMNGETIKITGCTVDKETVCTPRMFYHSNKARFIGQAYFIDFMDTEGKVIVDGHTLTLADGNRNTIRN